MKNGTKRALAILMVFAFTLVLLVGCGTKETPKEETTAATTTATTEATTAAPKEVKISYQTWIADASKDPVGCAFAEYNKKFPNVTFDTQVVDANANQSKLVVMVSSNNLPDMYLWNGDKLVNTLETSKATVDLTPYYTEDFKATLANAALLNLTTKDGKIAGFPLESALMGWLCNKDLFDQYSVKIPETFDEMKAAVTTFKKNNVVTIAMGTKDGWQTWVYQNWCDAWGIRDEGMALMNTHTLKVADSGQANVFKAIAELYDLGAFPPNNSTMTFDQQVNLYTTGKAAMINLPTDQFGKIIGTAVENKSVLIWNPVFTNAPEKSRNLVFKGVGNGLGVGANAEKDKDKLDAIIAFNKYRFSDEGVITALNSGFILPVKTTVDTTAYSPLLQQWAKLIGDDRPTIGTGIDIPIIAFYENYDNAVKYWIQMTDMFNALSNGSKRTKDLPVLFEKFDKLINDTAPHVAK